MIADGVGKAPKEEYALGYSIFRFVPIWGFFGCDLQYLLVSS